ncbi:MAG: D-alanine--D-alanine ligase [Ardenticatenales bacterium]|nr:D-alanine--D-alanine ligase [Ardenticatenales bacterium]
MAEQKRKLRVGVIFGGRSGEHDVSLQSAQSVMAALDKEKYEVVPIGITRQGGWLTGDPMMALAAGRAAAAQPATLLPDPESAALLQVEKVAARPAAMSEVAHLDVILPVLHGPNGEDGTVQGLLELAGIPYVGAGVVGSAVGMDKAIFKAVMQAHGIPVLPWKLVLKTAWLADAEAVLDEIEAALAYPVFTKPANLGSSVGICKCTGRDELRRGLDEAARYDRRLVVEQGIPARELEVAVLGNEDPIASVVGEVRPRRAFYDYVAKYMVAPGSADESELLIPAPLSAAESDEVRRLALAAYRAIDCAGLGRVDLLMDRESGALYLNEINTMPGFTRISMYPKLWEASGLPYPRLLDKLIELALAREAQKSALQRTYDAPVS